ncbi:armadillo beta-catenin plakoglobin [Phaffia rhodozyma]|uniref:uridine/cytidine kinase n=1 Tax=Phaffia rhodozyma TaxID=264483 RepID=A0A0F7SQ17_PHARH|nr:armadillo beta-catenin plakoglobin [Phaffia rhodozyma]
MPTPAQDPLLHDPSFIYASTPTLSRTASVGSAQPGSPALGRLPGAFTPVASSIPGNLKNVVLGRGSFGRPPWYDSNGKTRECYVIGIAGGSASGKTSVAREILRQLNHIPNVLILSQDSFYKRNSPEEIVMAFENNKDFDHPDSIDFKLFRECLVDLRNGLAVQISVKTAPLVTLSECAANPYEELTLSSSLVMTSLYRSRMPETSYLYGASVIIVEGILALTDPSLRDLFDLKVFVNCDTDLMLARRIRRDVVERGRDVMGIVDQYLRFVKPSYDNFVLPSSKFADIIVPGAQNNVAIDLIVTHIRRQLSERYMRFRSTLSAPVTLSSQPSSAKSLSSSTDPSSTLSPSPLASGSDKTDPQVSVNGKSRDHPNLVLVNQTSGVKGVVTILRDRKTIREDFVHYSDRLATIVVEEAIGLFPYKDKKVITPIEEVAVGKVLDLDPGKIIGVSLGRSGGPLEKGLRRVVLDARLGTLLIHNDETTQEPLLYNMVLPGLQERSFAEKAWVLLLDSQMGTGASALMAIRVLLDHHVPEDQILFLSFLVTPHSLKAIERAFPKVRIITSAIDYELEQITHHRRVHRGSLSESGQGLASGLGIKMSESMSGVQGKNKSEERVKELKEWVVRPGCGDIGDRYYLV